MITKVLAKKLKYLYVKGDENATQYINSYSARAVFRLLIFCFIFQLIMNKKATNLFLMAFYRLIKLFMILAATVYHKATIDLF